MCKVKKLWEKWDQGKQRQLNHGKKHTHTQTHKTPLLLFTGEMSVFLAESCQEDDMTQSTWRKGRLRLCEEQGDF